MPRALILGGTGLVGGAAARRLLASGWQVDLTGRNPGRMPADIAAAGGQFIPADRHDPAALRAAMGPGAELLVDCICYTAADAESLLPLAEAAGSTVLISSKAVYADAAGHHSNSDIPPHFDGPISESQPTVPPGDGDYQSRSGYGANKVAAERVLLDSGLPVSVLRPSKIHGRGAARPREWVFVKRVLDRRSTVFLAHNGLGVDHPTAAANIAALIETVAARPGNRILNSADPDAPNGVEIARAIAAHLDYVWDEICVEGDAPGAHPWDAAHPIVLDMSAAVELGYQPVGDYATTVADEIDWLIENPDARPAEDDLFFARYFDYAAEDEYPGRVF